MKLLEAGALDEGQASDDSVFVGGDASPDELTPRVDNLKRIVVTFPVFKDGRGFSLAAVLRGRGFKGELIARGALLADQARHLARTGFDAVELRADADAQEWRRALDTYTAPYQTTTADPAAPIWRRRAAAAALRVVETLEDKVKRLNETYRDASPQEILTAAIGKEFKGRVAVLTSFGAESAAGLHMVSEIAPETPVLFLDTERHFDPTLQYRDRLTARLGLTDVRSLKPEGAEAADPKGDLWRTNPDLCCAVRKVEPLHKAMAGFDALITGRKRFHGGLRMRLPVFEIVDGVVRINPFAGWSPEAIDAYYETHDLPRHPLVEGGYRSIGCWPCTQPSARDEDARAGRWAGLEKTECGIHLPAQWAASVEHRRAS
jgi:phosphoadenylyl-sulfate reductase (thioredoxin)